MEFKHVSILLEEVIRELDIKEDDIPICDNNICNKYGSKKCWLYWLLEEDN
jgi:hypothetical protein